MKATGIVRRIDDLGRVVIPKEIRRTMKIREGDPLEIYTSGSGEVIFKKYSPVGEMGVSARGLCEAMSRQSELTAIVTDRDHCIAAAGQGSRELMDKSVGEALCSVMESRKANEFSLESGAAALENANSPLRFAAPIIAGGDISGTVALVGDMAFSEADKKLALLAAAFLSKQLEV